jgi:transposase
MAALIDSGIWRAVRIAMPPMHANGKARRGAWCRHAGRRVNHIKTGVLRSGNAVREAALPAACSLTTVPHTPFAAALWDS